MHKQKRLTKEREDIKKSLEKGGIVKENQVRSRYWDEKGHATHGVTVKNP